MAKAKDDLFELCKETIAKYGERDGKLDSLEDFYFLEGDSEDKRSDPDQGGIEVVRLPHGTNVIDLIQDLLGGAELTITVPARSEKKGDKTLADVAERYLHAIMHQSERVQRQHIMGRVAWLASMRGALAGRVLPVAKWIKREKRADGDGEEWTVGEKVPLLIQLRDPRNVYPEFGVDGLDFVVEQCQRTVQDIRHTYGDDVLKGKPLTQLVQWTEYWTDRTFCYWADGEAVKVGDTKGEVPHTYGGNPYAFEFARQTGILDPAKRSRPVLEGQRNTIARMDLADSMEATFAAHYIGTAWKVWMERGEDDKAEADLSNGAINYLRPGANEDIEAVQAGRMPMELDRMRSRYSTVFERGTFPGTLYGEDPGRLVAGYAINLLNQSGQMRLAPIVDCIERFMESILSNVLMVSENYLQPALDNKPIPFSVYSEKEGDEGEGYRARDEQTLDADELDGYYHVEVKIGEVMPADQAANIELALQARSPDATGRPLLSTETIYEKFKLVGSSTEERHRIDRELAMENPEIKQLTEALVVAEVRLELENDLRKLGITPEDVLKPPPGAQGPGMPGPEEMPPELLAQIMGQGQGMPPPGMEGMSPGIPPGMPPEMMGGGMPPGVEGMMPPEETMPLVV